MAMKNLFEDEVEEEVSEELEEYDEEGDDDEEEDEEVEDDEESDEESEDTEEDDEEDEEEIEDDEDGEESGDDSDEDGDLEEDDDEDSEEEDDELEEYASLTPEATEWYKKATDLGKAANTTFLAKWVRQGKPIEQLTEYEIFTEDDLYNKFEEVMEGHDPNRKLVPLSNDQEGWDKFREDELNIPRDPDGYEDEVFFGADGQYRNVADTEEKREQYRNLFYRRSYSVEQAQDYIQGEQDKVEISEEEWKEHLDSYKNKEHEKLQQVLGKEDLKYWRNVIQKRLGTSDTGKALLQEFSKSKIVHSANFFGLLVELLSTSADLSDDSVKSAPLTKLSNDQLQAKEDKLYKRKELSDEFKHGNKSQQKMHRRVMRRLRHVQNEMQNRGLL